MKKGANKYPQDSGESFLRISHRKTAAGNSENFVEESCFNEDTLKAMREGLLPDLSKIRDYLSELNINPKAKLSATDFLPALRKFQLSSKAIEKVLSNTQTNHVLIQNDYIKIVLIRWDAGTSCKIHGHAIKGCVLKVLQGEVEEFRFSADEKQRLLSKNTYLKDSIAYIDDYIGLHSVCNKTEKPAVTLHMYTPGNYKPKNYLKIKN